MPSTLAALDMFQSVALSTPAMKSRSNRRRAVFNMPLPPKMKTPVLEGLDSLPARALASQIRDAWSVLLPD